MARSPRSPGNDGASGRAAPLAHPLRSAGTSISSVQALQAAFSRSPVGIALFDREGRMIETNPALCEILGYAREELLDADLAHLTYVDDRAEMARQVDRIRRGEVRELDLDKRYVRKDGTAVWVNLRASVAMESDGGGPVAIAYVTDIGSRKRIEEGLRHRAEFDRIVNRLATGFINTPRQQLDAAIEEALGEMSRFARAEHAGVVWFAQDGVSFEVSHEWSAAGVSPYAPIRDQYPTTPALVRETPLGRGEVLYVEDVTRDASLSAAAHAWLERVGVRSFVAVPLVEGGATTGFVGFTSEQPRAWDDETITLWQIGAHMIVNALDRKRSDDALHESEERFRQMGDNIGTLFWITQVNPPEMLYASKAFEKIWGVPLDTLRGGPDEVAPRVHPDDEIAHLQHYIDAMVSPQDLEFRIIRSDGRVRWLRTRTFPVKDTAGSTYRLAGVTDDVTEAKEAQQELQFRTALERLVNDLATRFINLPVGEIDDGIRAALERIGEVVALDRVAIFLVGAGDGSAVLGYEWHRAGQEPMLTTLAGDAIDEMTWIRGPLLRGESVMIESVDDLPAEAVAERGLLRRADLGSMLAVPMVAARGPIGFLGFGRGGGGFAWGEEWLPLFRIVTEVFVNALERKETEQQLRQSEQGFREIAENIREIFYVCDATGRRVLYLSPAYEAISGRARADVYASPSISYFTVFEEDRERVRERWVASVYAGDYSAEYRIVRADGQIRWLWDRATPVRDERGVVRRIVGIAEDVTDRKAAEESAARHQAELAHALRLGTMGELATGLAHELNQPLSAIANFAQGVERRLRSRDLDVDHLLDAIREVTRQALRAGDVIRRMRAHVRKGEARRERHELKELVVNALQFMRTETERRNVTVELHVASEPMPVHVDRIQIEQVVLNLVRNAFDAVAATGRDDGAVRVSIRPNDNGQAEVSVSDDGVGLPLDESESVFEPFVTTKRGGLGLGLSISRSIIDAHGGTIRACAGENGGAIFCFALPLSPPSMEVRDG